MSNGERIQVELDELIGRVLDGRYALDEYIDRGGFGAVYRGTDNRLRQNVAVKVGQSTREFMKEARLAVEVKHNHIVQVTDYGNDSGIAYLVMEYLQGETLEQLFIRQGRKLSPDQLRKLVFEIGDALMCAHAENLIHRDLKPRNIILKEYISKSGTTKGISKFVLFDFGIAAKIDSEGTLKNSARDLSGTIVYMAPEVLRRDSPATQQSDIYAFGVILYQMLTGQVPFPQIDGSQYARSECVRSIVTQPTPRFRDVVPDRKISPAMEEFVLQCLDKDPMRRPQSMEKVRERFLDIHDEEMERIALSLQPKPKSSSGVAWLFVFLLLLSIGGGVWWLKIQPQNQGETERTVVVPPWNPTFEYPKRIDLVTGQASEHKIKISSMPADAKLDITLESTEELSSNGIRIVVSPSKTDRLVWDLSLTAEPGAEPIDTIMLTAKTHENETSQLPINLRLIWLPPNFEPVDPQQLVRTDGIHYFNQIHRSIGTQKLEFLLITKPKGFGDPGNFYMMKEKVWRELFDAYLAENPKQISRDRIEAIHANWSKEDAEVSATSQASKKSNKAVVKGTSDHPRWPVTGLSPEEASLVADWIGGKLPTTSQWNRAAGYDFHRPPSGCQPPSDWKQDVWERGPFKEPWNGVDDPGIALRAFADVGTSSKDVSYYGCHDMAGNCSEFMRNSVAGLQLPLSPDADQNIVVRGKAIGSSFPLYFKDFSKPPAHRFNEADDNTSFRIVVER